MILDNLENLRSYFPLHHGFAKAFDFLCRADLNVLQPGKYTIDGENIFAIIVNEKGKDKEDGSLEIHRKYIDIQFVLSGTDEMGWKPKGLCSCPQDNFDEDKDLQFFNDKPDSWIAVQPNSYAIFFPEDAHMAMFSEEIIHKVIIKIAVDCAETG